MPRTITGKQYRLAAELIRNRGWTQYQLCADSGAYCIAGAINTAANGRPEWGEDQDDYGLLVRLIRERYPEFSPRICSYRTEAVENESFVMQWNNTLGRKWEEVAEILELAAVESWTDAPA